MGSLVLLTDDQCYMIIFPNEKKNIHYQFQSSLEGQYRQRVISHMCMEETVVVSNMAE